MKPCHTDKGGFDGREARNNWAGLCLNGISILLIGIAAGVAVAHHAEAVSLVLNGIGAILVVRMAERFK